MRQGGAANALAVTIGLLLFAADVFAQIVYQVSPRDPFALVASGTMLAAALCSPSFPGAPVHAF